MKRHIWAFLLVMVGLLTLPAVTVLAGNFPAAAKQVLVIHSYHPGLSWTEDVTKGIRDVLDHSGQPPVDMSWEYLDARRFTDPENATLIRQLLIRKLKWVKPDLVMVSDNTALEFALKRRSDLFPDVPIVFCGINNYHPSLISGFHDITGVAEDVSLGQTVRIALRLHPTTKEIIVIGRTSVAADMDGRQLFAAPLPGLPAGIAVTFWDDLPLSELRSRLAKLKSGSLVFINGLLRDETGRPLMYGETAEWVSRYASVPLYALWDIFLGHGIVGGKLVSGYHQGRLAAGLALRILNGESAERIPVISAEDSNRFQFDYRQMERFGITSADLPQGSTIVNRSDSFYQRHRVLLWSAALVIFALSAVVFFLAGTIIRMRRAEEQLRRANLVVENSPVFLYRIKAAEGWPVELVSRNIIQLGYSPEEILAGSVSVASIIWPEDLEKVTSALEDFESRGIDRFQREYRIVTRDGDVRWLDDRTVVARDATGRITHYQGIAIDSTDRKKAVEALQEKSAENDRIFNFSLDLLAIARVDGTLLRVNPAWEKVLGYRRDELEGRSFMDLLHPDDVPATVGVMKVLAEGKDVIDFTNRYRCKDGSWRWIEWRSTLHQSSLFYAAARDITERKRTEQALISSEAHFRGLFENLPVSIWVEDFSAVASYFATLKTNGVEDLAAYLEMNPDEEVRCARLIKVIDINSATLDLHGAKDKEELLGNIDRTFTRESFVAFRKGLVQLWNGETELVTDTEVQTLSGNRRNVVVHWLVVPGCEQTFDRVLVSFMDITARKQAEQRFAVAFRSSPDSININRLSDGLYLEVNEGFTDITGYSADEVIGKTSLELNIWVHVEDRQRLVDALTQDGHVLGMEVEFRRKDGTTLFGQMSGRIIEIEGTPCILNFIRDVTERRRTDEQLRASLAEKVVLLKEVHHRVKNNLQIICSLLELQAESIHDAHSLTSFMESQNRIRSMALIHETLYQSENFAFIYLKDYIESLAESLFFSYGKVSDLIALNVDVEEVSLGMDEAIPCGLIVNELISNSLKHAFPDNRKGAISVQCLSNAGGWITLTVSDDGVGLPSGMDFRNTESLGLQLVTMLVKQLRGNIEVGGAGVSYVIRFKSTPIRHPGVEP